MKIEKKYVYNEEQDTYVVVLKKASGQIVVDGATHRDMQRAYCGPEGKSIEEICSIHGFSKPYFEEYKNLFGWTRDGMPLSDEVIEEQTVETSSDQILEMKKFDVLQEANKKEWKETQDNSNKWLDFLHGRLLPFQSALRNWCPPKVEVAQLKKPEKKGRWLVLVCSDWQIGLQADGRFLYRQKDWNTSKAKKALIKMTNKIISDAANSNQEFEGAYILLAGDLHHGLKGETEKGTKLQIDEFRDNQVDALMNALSQLIMQFAQFFPKIDIRAVRGNHDGTDFYPIALALKNAFKDNSNVKFTVYSERTAVFKINKTLILLDHGASDLYSSDVPRQGKPRESYIQSLILAYFRENPKAVQGGINQILFIQGDKHHYEHIEYADFEFLMTGALPLGDQYADNSNLNSRSRQNVFVIDKEGLKMTLHYYTDTCV